MRDVHAARAPVEEQQDPRLSALERRYQRERLARKAAEAALEEKSGELYELNKELELQLSGSVKVLADVLAMARPELFQQAGKVQRWARHIAPLLDVKRFWELDLAAMLYPLGMLALPDELTSKKVLRGTLSAEEQAMINESAGAAYSLISNIPKMMAVADTVLYCNKGYDGSGFPDDEKKGEDIPQSARILKILIDLADVATGVDRRRDFQALLDKRNLYDINILKVAYETLNIEHVEKAYAGDYLTVEPGQLIAGDVVRADIVDVNDQLLLAAGSVLSDITVRRLVSLSRAERMTGPVKVARS